MTVFTLCTREYLTLALSGAVDKLNLEVVALWPEGMFYPSGGWVGPTLKR